VYYIQIAAIHAAPYEKHGQTARIAGEEEARNTRARRKEIIEEIKRIRGSYGQKNAEIPRSILFIVVKKLFDKIEEWARHERVIDASKRVEITTKRLEVVVEKLGKQEEIIRGNAIYAQVASRRIIGIY
jgi:uncharacterized coiled-coil DUF342 family protein